MKVRTLDVAGDAAEVSLHPLIYSGGAMAGASYRMEDRSRSGWTGVLRMFIEGRNGGERARLTLTASQARDLAAKLTRQADFAEARAKREPAPCLCTAWRHNLYPCPNVAAEDFSMCRECWTPETGQSLLDMGHGKPVSA